MIWNPFRKLQKVEEKRSILAVKFDPKRVTPAIQKALVALYEAYGQQEEKQLALETA